ncbi:acireductone synthase [Embleya sp. AB8]|uniref:acireductone synthase n=1 Tax=Embleya sp. AB8 TaxID=3156304 RepID=UPI003C77EF50
MSSPLGPVGPLGVVVDIEGTTSATGFITEQLYPYSRKHFARWLDEHGDHPDVVRAVTEVRDLLGDPEADTRRIVEALNGWLDRDEKVTPLKSLQGLIWAEGFASGELTSHFYPDVIPALRAWHAAGHRLYVFSSGSVAAQRAWFGSSPEGSLLPLFSGHFDTGTAGPKRIAESYRSIAEQIGESRAERLVFLSDVVEELDAAREAGWCTVGVRRPGVNEPYYDRGVGDHSETATFARVDLDGDGPVLRPDA